ncbi:MAG: chemotaxis protein CheB [Desulfuromonadaceae bacterium]|nr:chemotaxis protein CheB [Desulfuromonadaceae bacterium]
MTTSKKKQTAKPKSPLFTVTLPPAAASFPIVGIGTSAGGLEALELFLGHVPKESGMAFVVVQHLSPNHVGNLPELLQRSTAMKVQQVNDAVRVEPDSVYVIPPNKDMTISNRTLHLQKPDVKHGLRLPIDTFLRSLAADCGERSIGVILSGMGSDGTLGMCAIKEQGGLTLVQEAASAKFDSMPKSVENAGFADIIAPAEALPAKIVEYLNYATTCWAADQKHRDKEQSHFDRITTILKARTRHDFSLYKPSSVYRRIERRMSVHKIDTIAEYARFLEKNAQEVELLFKELLIGVTSFFRDAAMWKELQVEALPKILAAYPAGGALRAWSCGCSTGEEAYSLAMLFREALDQNAQPDNYTLQIFATDLDADAIDKARRGLYTVRIEADVSPERLQRFFIKEEGNYRVCREIREMVTFAQQNAIMDPPFTRLDILLCRNLLIYLTTDLQKQLLPLFHYSLKPGGLLFLGSAETVGSQIDLFSAATVKSKLFWRSKNVVHNGLISFPTSLPSTASVLSHQESLMFKTADNLQTLADGLILQHFSAPTVLVNDQGDILYISGRTGKYLEPAAGKANMNIFAMAREGLQYKLDSAFNKVIRQSEPVTVRGELAGSDNRLQAVDMTLMRIETPEALRGMVLIAFRDVTLPPKARRRRTGMLPDSSRTDAVEQELLKYREDLRITREEMQAAHEELKSTNEELQSTNEELQSTNEELTTSKEELQSMNEELQSVNSEQSNRLDEFMQVNSDMENLLNSTEVVTIFLDNHLQVRRFTCGANRLFKLIPGDVGRPLTDIVSNLNYPELYEHVQDVLRKLISVENQVTTSDGRWFLVRIMPYRTSDKRINGVVITCNDITAAKKVEDELRAEIARLKMQKAG